MTKIEDYITIANIVSKDDCDKIISRTINNNLWATHKWYLSSGKQPTDTSSVSHNDSGNEYVDKIFTHDEGEPESQDATEEIQSILCPYIDKTIDKYGEKIFTKGQLTSEYLGQFVTEFTTPRLNRYNVGASMRTHRDHIYGIFDGTKRGIPVISFVGVLNDDYEGGEFVINDKIYYLGKGDILTFPSNFMYEHEVLEITKGVRYSFVSWAY